MLTLCSCCEAAQLENGNSDMRASHRNRRAKAPVYSSKGKFWNYGIGCIGCSVFQDLGLIGGGLDGLLRDIVYFCDHAVAMLRLDGYELLQDAIYKYFDVRGYYWD